LLQHLSLDLADAQRGIAAALAGAAQEGRPMAAAVVDAAGDLIACARMDGAHERILRFAIRKAYTAATMGRETTTLKEELEKHGRTLDDYGDAQFTTLQGGVPVVVEGHVVGAVAVGGGSLEGDKAIARLGAQAILEGLK
jgi:glc operon protein GlcG